MKEKFMIVISKLEDMIISNNYSESETQGLLLKTKSGNIDIEVRWTQEFRGQDTKTT